MTTARRIRLFLDSNVLLAGIISRWGLDKAVLSLCAARVCKLVLADFVRDEVEENLLSRADALTPHAAEALLKDYRNLIELLSPESIPYPHRNEVMENRHLIRHEADVPVLLSAIVSRPDWLLTHNTKHFNRAVARRTSLRIATPADFFRELAALLR